MDDFKDRKECFDNALRTTTIIIPLVRRGRDGKSDIRTLSILNAEEISFDSESMWRASC